MVNGGNNTIYSDELISATELNRQPGRVLDIALQHPVTITRNDQAFALLRREDMALVVKAAAQTKVVVEIINVAYQLNQEKDIDTANNYQWLRVFDREELNELVGEIIDAFRLGCNSGDWDMLDAAIHEWYESAIAINSSELQQAFSAEVDEVPLTSPSNKDGSA